MERNTATTLGTLTIADRFYFCTDKRRTVWQVTGSNGSKWITYNKFTEKGEKQCRFDELKSAGTPVVFLRNANDKS